jgi:outer membrane protein assembly factor BamB
MPFDLKSQLGAVCITRREVYAIISPGGKSQNWLIDLRSAFLDPNLLTQICDAMFARYVPDHAVQFAGMETAAIPLLTGLLIHGDRRSRTNSGLIIRKERKPTGLGKAVEGTITGDPVILVDDIFNSGDSAEKARVSLEAVAIKPFKMIVVIDYESEEGKLWQQQTGIEVQSLFKLPDFGLSLNTKSILNREHRYLRKLWQYKAGDPFPYYVVPKSAPLLVGQRLLFGTDSGSIHCLDADTGKTVWKFKAPGTHAKGIWSSAAHHEGRIYFGAYNGNVYCLDATTGSKAWDQAYCEWIGSSPCVVPGNGHLYVGLEYERPRQQGSVVALDLATGEKVWEHWLKVYQHGSGVYWREGDLVIFGTNDHDVRALDCKTGRLVWRFETRRSVKYMPRIDDERKVVAFASFDGSIYVLDVRDGRMIAEFPTDNICYTQPLITHGRIFCGSGDRHLYVIDLDGMKLIKKIDCGARVYSSPRVIGGNSVIFGTNGGIVRELDPVTLQITGKLIVPDAVTNAVAFTEDGTRVFVPTYMNEIYCYERTITS